MWQYLPAIITALASLVTALGASIYKRRRDSKRPPPNPPKGDQS